MYRMCRSLASGVIFMTAGFFIMTSSVVQLHNLLSSRTGSWKGTSRFCSQRINVGRSWYGPIAYPELRFERQSWKWLQTFLASITRLPSSENLTSDALQFLNSLWQGNSRCQTIIEFVTFPNSSFSELERKIDSFSHNSRTVIRRTLHPRYSWTDGSSAENFGRRTKNPTGSICSKGDSIDTLVVNFLYSDLYEVELFLRSTYCVKTLLTSFITEPANVTRDQNYPLLTYELLHRIFFSFFWFPQIADWSDCYNQRHDCRIWILWALDTENKMRYTFPPAADGSTIMELQRLRAYYNNPESSSCQLYQEIAGKRTKKGFMDGTKAVCLDGLPQQPRPKNCLIYSFGISDDWSFDDAMHSLGCSVFSFDPSIGLQEYKRNASHWFYPWGLPGRHIKKKWIVHTLLDIRTQLGHAEARINILKMDVEGAELYLLNSSSLGTALKNVDQILMEIHAGGRSNDAIIFRQQARLLHNLERHGFVMFYSRRNPLGQDARVEFYPKKNLFANTFLYELSFKRIPRGCE